MADITKINLNGTDLTIVDSAATSAIAGEIARAQGAESAITSALSAEVVARQSADTALETAISGKADASAVYTKTEVDNALSGKADTATTLSGYGITDAYTKTETDNAITAATSGLQHTLSAGTGIEITSGNVINCTIDTGLYVVVQELPQQPAAGNENKIHLVPLPVSATGQNDQYEEYLWKGTEWEYLGVRQADIDLSDYWTSAQTQSAITTATSGKVDTSAYTAYTAATDSAITDVQALVEDAISVFGKHIYEQGNLEDILADAGIAYYDIENEEYVVNQMATQGYIPTVANAEYNAQTETLILNLPAPPSE